MFILTTTNYGHDDQPVIKGCFSTKEKALSFANCFNVDTHVIIQQYPSDTIFGPYFKTRKEKITATREQLCDKISFRCHNDKKNRITKTLNLLNKHPLFDPDLEENYDLYKIISREMYDITQNREKDPWTYSILRFKFDMDKMLYDSILSILLSKLPRSISSLRRLPKELFRLIYITRGF